MYLFNRIICKLLGHKRVGDKFHGHWCSRCGVWFDWGILEKYRGALPATIRIPKMGRLSPEDLVR